MPVLHSSSLLSSAISPGPPCSLLSRFVFGDPDDPNFHPVKDVLDRLVMMQLRKIGFSALIYGVLVIVCLGGVMWSLHLATAESVLPIHWSSNEPVLWICCSTTSLCLSRTEDVRMVV